jgi:hypothetical protein
MEEEFKPEEQQEEDQEGSNSWLKDNLRIIISIIIVIVIAGGIYSFSKRSQTLLNEQQVSSEEKVATDNGSVEIKPTDTTTTIKGQVAVKQAPSAVATSKETDVSFVETAVKGEGQTHLARRALANYLEKNADSSLTAEHKIYIEDYLRKKSGFKGGVHIGSTIDFSKDNIKAAIEASKNLSEKQLKNLHKYAVRVPSLS